MNTKEKIFKYLEKKKSVTGKELSEFLGISRQAINKHLKELISNSRVAKEGTTRGVVYRYPVAKRRVQSVKRFGKEYFLQGLEEHKVFRELMTFLSLKSELSKNTLDIGNYTFTEILNNAIEHSESRKSHVEVSLDQYRFNFRIRDFGIGIFYSIFTKFNLLDENAAIGELIKGKTTTMKEKHSGEGIFFTSKSADIVSFRSHKINLIFDNQKKDVFVEERKFIKGTEVDFSISRRSGRRLDKLFTEFAPEEFEYRFEKTRVLVKLFKKDCISRSEAKRLLSELDKFREIILDFEGVKSIGQGFADEIFRVFRNAHPDMIIKTENLSPSLKQIINHVVDNKKIF
jgi:anti-sigma regulatory factor (Ser/Thr protein kinase)